MNNIFSIYIKAGSEIDTCTCMYIYIYICKNNIKLYNTICIIKITYTKCILILLLFYHNCIISILNNIVVDLQQKLYNNSEPEIVHIIWLEGE